MVSYTTRGFTLPLSIELEITTGPYCQRLDAHIAKRDFIPAEQSLSWLKCFLRGWITFMIPGCNVFRTSKTTVSAMNQYCCD